MTKDEILAQAKVGGFLILRVPINQILCNLPDPICVWEDRWPDLEEIIAIEPPPETLEQENARLKAELANAQADIDRMEKVLNSARLEARVKELDALKAIRG